MSNVMTAGWYQDPAGRHKMRYHDGRDWTAHVLDPTGPLTEEPPAPVGIDVSPSQPPNQQPSQQPSQPAAVNSWATADPVSDRTGSTVWGTEADWPETQSEQEEADFAWPGQEDQLPPPPVMDTEPVNLVAPDTVDDTIEPETGTVETAASVLDTKTPSQNVLSTPSAAGIAAASVAAAAAATSGAGAAAMRRDVQRSEAAPPATQPAPAPVPSQVTPQPAPAPAQQVAAAEIAQNDPPVSETATALAPQRRSLLPYLIAGLLALALIIGLILILGGDDEKLGGANQLEANSFQVYEVELSQGQSVRFRARPTDAALDLAIGLGTTPNAAREGTLAFARATEGTDLFTDLFDELPEEVTDVPTQAVNDLYANYTLGISDELAVSAVVPYTNNAGNGIGEADWTVAPADGTYYLYVYEVAGQEGNIEVEIEKGAAFALNADDLLAQLTNDEFLSTDDFFTGYDYKPSAVAEDG